MPLLGVACEEPRGYQIWASPQTEPIALSLDGSTLYVAHTTAGRLVSLDLATGNSTYIDVGMEPVSVEVRPDGQEVWVANHVSDTISIVDPSQAAVVATIQDLDANLVTHFDEPADIAFDGNGKAYVSLSSSDRIAIIDVATRTITGHLDISAQDPRAIAVRDGLLYVTAFEGGNQSEVSACAQLFPPGTQQCSLGLIDVFNFATNPNLPGSTKNIVIDPQTPDRDLFVYDTTNDSLVTSVTGLGTLQYGITVDSNGRAFIANTDARNAVNGLDGDSLADLQNRMFLNRVTALTCDGSGCGAASFHELEPAPGNAIPAGQELATPHGIRISDDDATLVGTASGTSRLFTMNATTGAVQGILDLGAGASFGQQIPRGLVLRSDPGTGAAQTAYVLNSLEDTVSVVDVSNPASPTLVVKHELPQAAGPPDEMNRGRVAFMNAFASSSGTFSCESCHPDGNTDQLLWRIGGACNFGACSGDDEPRTTMPVRGLKNTLPLHWDGSLGDPFGGPDGSTGIGGNLPANCTDEASCFRHLVNASLSGVMCDQSDSCAGGGELSPAERDDMAAFLANVAYPPARSRPVDDVLSASAMNGFADFFVDQGGNAGDPGHLRRLDGGLPRTAAGHGHQLLDPASLRRAHDARDDRSIPPVLAGHVERGGAPRLRQLEPVGSGPRDRFRRSSLRSSGIRSTRATRRSPPSARPSRSSTRSTTSGPSTCSRCSRKRARALPARWVARCN